MKKLPPAGARGAEGTKGATGNRGKNPQRGVRADLPAPKFEERIIPYYDEPQFKGRLEEVNDLALEVVSLQKEKKGIEEQIAEKNALVRALMEDIDSKQSWSIRSDDWTAMYVRPKPRKSLVPELLISAGVTLKQIRKGTKLTPVTPFASIRERGEEGSNGGS